jgi:hypothetical protein
LNVPELKQFPPNDFTIYELFYGLAYFSTISCLLFSAMEGAFLNRQESREDSRPTIDRLIHHAHHTLGNTDIGTGIRPKTWLHA